MRFLWLLLFWVLATPAFSASFDCSADSLSTVEQLICQRPELSQLDTQLAKQFKSTREVMDNSVLRASQIHWMTHHQRPCGQVPILILKWHALPKRLNNACSP